MRVTHVYRRNISTITFGFSDEPKETVYGVMDSLAIDKTSRSNQLMVTECVVRELVGLCAQRSYKARLDVTES
jgi:hypothetical protein